MQMKIILSFLILLSLVFLVPSDAFGAITTATVTLEKSLEVVPLWVTNLAVWVSEDKITLADIIVSIEHLINN